MFFTYVWVLAGSLWTHEKESKGTPKRTQEIPRDSGSKFIILYFLHPYVQNIKPFLFYILHLTSTKNRQYVCSLRKNLEVESHYKKHKNRIQKISARIQCSYNLFQWPLMSLYNLHVALWFIFAVVLNAFHQILFLHIFILKC